MNRKAGSYRNDAASNSVFEKLGTHDWDRLKVKRHTTASQIETRIKVRLCRQPEPLTTASPELQTFLLNTTRTLIGRLEQLGDETVAEWKSNLDAQPLTPEDLKILFLKHKEGLHLWKEEAEKRQAEKIQMFKDNHQIAIQNVEETNACALRELELMQNECSAMEETIEREKRQMAENSIIAQKQKEELGEDLNRLKEMLKAQETKFEELKGKRNELVKQCDEETEAVEIPVRDAREQMASIKQELKNLKTIHARLLTEKDRLDAVVQDETEIATTEQKSMKAQMEEMQAELSEGTMEEGTLRAQLTKEGKLFEHVVQSVIETYELQEAAEEMQLEIEELRLQKAEFEDEEAEGKHICCLSEEARANIDLILKHLLHPVTMRVRTIKRKEQSGPSVKATHGSPSPRLSDEALEIINAFNPYGCIELMDFLGAVDIDLQQTCVRMNRLIGMSKSEPEIEEFLADLKALQIRVRGLSNRTAHMERSENAAFLAHELEDVINQARKVRRDSYDYISQKISDPNIDLASSTSDTDTAPAKY